MDFFIWNIKTLFFFNFSGWTRVDPGWPLKPGTRPLGRVNPRAGFNNYGWRVKLEKKHRFFFKKKSKQNILFGWNRTAKMELEHSKCNLGRISTSDQDSKWDEIYFSLFCFLNWTRYNDNSIQNWMELTTLLDIRNFISCKFLWIYLFIFANF
jgi:hypothetical protein